MITTAKTAQSSNGMNRMPSVSVVMPAYNVSRYIREAIESVIRQTFTEWELVIVDDGSTDDTLALACEYERKDHRIRVIKMPYGSGSVYQPRKRAIMEACAEIVAPLDADDMIENTYLEKLLHRMRQTGAEAVYPTLYRVDSDGKHPRILIDPRPEIKDHAHRGRDCVKWTLGKWEIGCGGGMIRKNLYERVYAENDSSLTHSFADELVTRQLLLDASLVAISDAKYFYRENDESETRKKSVKKFWLLINDEYLNDFVIAHYGKYTEEYLKIQEQIFYDYYGLLKFELSFNIGRDNQESVRQMMYRGRRLINREILRGRVSKKYMLLNMLGNRSERVILKIALKLHIIKP